MLLGRVVGTLVASCKEPSLEGLKFLVLKQTDIEGKETGFIPPTPQDMGLKKAAEMLPTITQREIKIA